MHFILSCKVLCLLYFRNSLCFLRSFSYWCRTLQIPLSEAKRPSVISNALPRTCLLVFHLARPSTPYPLWSPAGSPLHTLSSEVRHLLVYSWSTLPSPRYLPIHLTSLFLNSFPHAPHPSWRILESPTHTRQPFPTTLPHTGAANHPPSANVAVKLCVFATRARSSGPCEPPWRLVR